MCWLQCALYHLCPVCVQLVLTSRSLLLIPVNRISASLQGVRDLPGPVQAVPVTGVEPYQDLRHQHPHQRNAAGPA